MSAPAVTTSRQLYKHLMRVVHKLPKQSQHYYRHNIKQQYVSHNDEADAARLQQIITRALQDAEWIRQKYGVDDKTA